MPGFRLPLLSETFPAGKLVLSEMEKPPGGMHRETLR